MPEVGEVKYTVVIDNTGVDKDAQDTGNKIQSQLDAVSQKLDKSFGYQILKDIGGAFIDMGKQAVSAFVDITKSAVDSVASLEQNVGGVETLFKSSSDTVIANAQRAYETAGLSANQYMETVTGFSASLLQSLGGDTEAAAKVADMAVTDMSDNANKMGTDMSSIQAAYQGFAKQNYTMLDNLKLGYGGTKSEMERLIADANRVKEANGEMGDLSIDSFADVTEAIHIMQTEMDITGTTAREAATTLEGSLNATKAAWDNLLNGSGTAEEFAEAAMTYVDNLLTNLETIIPRIAEMFPAILEVFAEHAPEIFEAVGGILDTLFTSLGEALPALLEVVGSMIENVLTSIMENAPAILEYVLTLVMDIVGGIAANLPQIVTQVVGMLGNVLSTIMAALPDLIKAGVQIVTSLVLGLVQEAPNLILQIGNMLTDLVNQWASSGPQMMEQGVNMILNIINGIVSNLPAIISAIVQVITQLIATIAQNAPQFMQKGIELLVQLATGIIRAIPQLIAQLPQIFYSIMNALASYDWLSLGLNIIYGLANGIASGAYSVWNALVGAVQSAWNSVLSWLGIASPSKRARDEIGKRIPQGAAQGIEAESDLVTDAMVDTYKTAFDVAEQFTSDIAYNVPDVGNYAADLGAQLSYSSEQTIVVPVNLDGREIARVTAPFMGEQLAWEG